MPDLLEQKERSIICFEQEEEAVTDTGGLLDKTPEFPDTLFVIYDTRYARYGCVRIKATEEGGICIFSSEAYARAWERSHLGTHSQRDVITMDFAAARNLAKAHEYEALILADNPADLLVYRVQ